MSDVQRPTPSPLITAARWAQLEPLIDTALDLEPAQRAAYIDDIKARDPALGAELFDAIQQHENADSVFGAPAAERFAGLLDVGAPVDLMAKLQESFGATYTLERELGGGGMSRVFLAHEGSLGRKVVIKVLAPELAEGISADRFEREIKLAASLQQANIVPLLSAGVAAGFPYYTMPLVEGRSLRERLARDETLPTNDAVNVLRDIARALAFAHERGVVHRDIKPGNVLLSGGTAVVSDFGIAKAIGAARTTGGAGAAITQTGTGIGTPAYMAPEQASGDPAMDHRADIYSFGCVAYEVFAGTPPFHGQASHQIIAAHFHEKPPPLTTRRADVPPAVAQLVASCLEKDPGRRPQSAAELLQGLDAVTTQPVVARRRSRAVVMAGVATAVVLLGATAYFAQRRGGTTPAIARQPLAFAIVPFRNETRDTGVAFHADGISDEILTAMAKVPGIQIVGRNAALRYRDRVIDERAIERELGARFLVTGSLRQSGARLKVSVQLNDSMTRAELWSDSFERDVRDFAAVTDDIVARMTDALRARFVGQFGERKRGVSTAGTRNAEAFDLYLVGQALMKRRGGGIEQAADAFERAIALDSNFARAHAGLARALEFYPYFVGTAPESVRVRATNAARRALQLDSTLADAHTALASISANLGQWEGAWAEFEQAIKLEPDNFEAHFNYGRFLTTVGRFGQARVHFEHARKLERVSALVSAWMGRVLLANGQTDSARKESMLAVQLDPTFPTAINKAIWVNVASGHLDEARRLLSSAVIPLGFGTNAAAYAAVGDTATAMNLIRKMEAHDPPFWFTHAKRAFVMLAIGDTARALSALEQSYALNGALWASVLDPGEAELDKVRGSPRFAALLKKSGLDVATLTAPRAGRQR